MEDKDYSITIQEDIIGLPEQYHSAFEGIVVADINGKTKDAIRRTRSLLKVYNDRDSGLVRLKLARILMKDQKLREAERILNGLIKEDLQTDRARVVLANVKIMQKQYEAAEALLSEIPLSDKTYADWYSIKLSVYQEQDRYGEFRDCVMEFMQYDRECRKRNPDTVTDCVQMLILLLEMDVKHNRQELLKEDTDRMIAYLHSRGRSDREELILMNLLSQYSVTVNKEVWPRDEFLRLADGIRDEGWCSSEQGTKFLESCFASVESYRINEDETLHPILKSMTFRGEEKDREAFLLDEWCAARLYEEDPSQIDYLKNQYPHTWNQFRIILNNIVNDPAAVKERVENQLMILHKGRSKELIQSTLEADFQHFNTHDPAAGGGITMDLGMYPERVRVELAMMLEHYYGMFYDLANDAAAALLKHYDDADTGIVRFVRCASLCRMKRGKEALRIAERLLREFPDSKKTQIAYGASLFETHNLKKAVRTLENVGIPNEELQFYSDYVIAAFTKSGRGSEVRQKLLDVKNVIETGNAGSEIDAAYHYASYLSCCIQDILETDRELLRTDLDALFAVLEGRTLETMEELFLAKGITEFCSLAMEEEWPVPFFGELIRWCDEHQVFHEQTDVIESGYEVYEQREMELDPKISRALYEYVYCLTHPENISDQGEDPLIQDQLTWFASFELEDPSMLTYLFDTYPHCTRICRTTLFELSQDPAGKRKQAIRAISNETGIGEEIVRVNLETARQQQKRLNMN